MPTGTNGASPPSLGFLDRDSIAHAIDDGLARGLSSLEIADTLLEPIRDPKVAKVLTHPARMRAIALLRRDGRLSPSDACAKLGLSLGVMAYHFRVLQRAHVIELCDTAQRRGATEHYYRLTDTA